MKKFLLGTVGLVALGMAAPASAADLAARPYTKAPPPYVAPIYDWTGFYIGANGGWGDSHNCVDFLNTAGVVPSLPAAAIGPVASSAVSSVIAGKPAMRVFGLEAQGDWADLSNQRVSLIDLFALHFQVYQNQWHRPLHRPDRLRLECVIVLREGRRRGDRQPLQRPRQHFRH